jgi:GAF domain-containing protein
VVAEAIKKETIKITPHSIPLEEFEDIAQSVVFYAIRTRKQVVLDDATHDGMFSYSRYIKKNNSKSILCVPVITHDRLIGILYLENTELVKTFSPKLVELLTTLVSHVAVSIENRLLHEDMDRIKQETRSTRERLEQRIQILEQKLRDDP